jgi:hypothetical protein
MYSFAVCNSILKSVSLNLTGRVKTSDINKGKIRHILRVFEPKRVKRECAK